MPEYVTKDQADEMFREWMQRKESEGVRFKFESLDMRRCIRNAFLRRKHILVGDN